MLLFHQKQALSMILACLRDVIVGQSLTRIVSLSSHWGLPIVRNYLSKRNTCDQMRKRSLLAVTGSARHYVLAVSTIHHVVTTQDIND